MISTFPIRASLRSALLPLGSSNSVPDFHVLMADSQAIDFVSGCTMLEDQRGAERQDPCTAGAIEFGAPPPTTTTTSTVVTMLPSTTAETAATTTTVTAIAEQSLADDSDEAADDGDGRIPPAVWIIGVVVAGLGFLFWRRSEDS